MPPTWKLFAGLELPPPIPSRPRQAGEHPVLPTHHRSAYDASILSVMEPNIPIPALNPFATPKATGTSSGSFQLPPLHSIDTRHLAPRSSFVDSAPSSITPSPISPLFTLFSASESETNTSPALTRLPSIDPGSAQNPHLISDEPQPSSSAKRALSGDCVTETPGIGVTAEKTGNKRKRRANAPAPPDRRAIEAFLLGSGTVNASQAVQRSATEEIRHDTTPPPLPSDASGSNRFATHAIPPTHISGLSKAEELAIPACLLSETPISSLVELRTGIKSTCVRTPKSTTDLAVMILGTFPRGRMKMEKLYRECRIRMDRQLSPELWNQVVETGPFIFDPPDRPPQAGAIISYDSEQESEEQHRRRREYHQRLQAEVVRILSQFDTAGVHLTQDGAWLPTAPSAASPSNLDPQ